MRFSRVSKCTRNTSLAKAPLAGGPRPQQVISTNPKLYLKGIRVIAPKRVISRIASAIRAHNVYHRLFRNPLFGQFVDENLNLDVTECDFYGTDVSIVF